MKIYKIIVLVICIKINGLQVIAQIVDPLINIQWPADDFSSKFDSTYFLGKRIKSVNLGEGYANQQALIVEVYDSSNNLTKFVFNNLDKSLHKKFTVRTPTNFSDDLDLPLSTIYPNSKLRRIAVLSDELSILSSKMSVALFDHKNNKLISEIVGPGWGNGVEYRLTQDGNIGIINLNDDVLKLFLFDKNLKFLRCEKLDKRPDASFVVARFEDSTLYSSRRNGKIHLFVYQDNGILGDTLATIETVPSSKRSSPAPFGFPNEYFIKSTWFFWTYEEKLNAYSLNVYDLKTRKLNILFTTTTLERTDVEIPQHERWAVLEDGRYLVIQTFFYDPKWIIKKDQIDCYETATGKKLWSKSSSPNTSNNRLYDDEPYFRIWQGKLVYTHFRFKKTCTPCNDLTSREQAEEVSKIMESSTGRIILEYTTELGDRGNRNTRGLKEYYFNEHRIFAGINALGEAYLFVK